MLLAYLTLLLVGMAFALGTIWVRVRRHRQRVVVQTLASIVSENLPLVPALRAAAAPERGALKRVYWDLSERLARGDELSTALRLTLPGCPGEVVGALEGAERGGTLPGVLQAQAALLHDAGADTAGLRLPLWYPAIVLIAGPFVVGFFIVMIVPKFRDIFADFNTQLPDITIALIDASGFIYNNVIWIAGLLFALLLLIAEAVLVRHFLRRTPGRTQPLFVIWDALAWSFPGARHVVQGRALHQQLLIMQAGLRAGHDLVEAARQGACAAVNIHAQRRLARWTERLAEGSDPTEAARRLGFPRPFIQALAGARADGELSARLEYLAGYYQALHVHWARVLAGTLTPLMVIAWGVLVGFIVVALFLPLVALLEGVMRTVE
ncbi:MAG: type II secretion system F family protein [Planctomycetota bacterium]